MQDFGALFWRASGLVNLMREVLGHHLEACFAARFPQESMGQGGPNCCGIVTSDVLVKGLSCGAIATRKLEGVNRDKGHERVYTSSAPYGEGKAYV